MDLWGYTFFEHAATKNGKFFLEPPKNCRESLNHRSFGTRTGKFWLEHDLNWFLPRGFLTIHGNSIEFLARNMDWSMIKGLHLYIPIIFEKFILIWWHRWWKESGVYQLRLVVYLIIHIVFIHPRYIPDGADFLPCLSMLHATSLKQTFFLNLCGISWWIKSG